LRCAGFGSKELLLRENTSFQECDDEAVHLRVSDTTASPLHQAMMADVIETSLDVPFDGPWVWKPYLRPVISLHVLREKQLAQFLQRSVNSAPRTKAVRARKKVRLEHRLQDILHRCLNYPVSHGRNFEGTKLPRLAWFRNEHSTNGARPIYT